MRGDAKPDLREPGFMRDEFPLIKSAVILLGASLALAVVLIVISSFALSSQQAKRLAATQQYEAARSKLQEAENEKREVLNFQPKFIQLRASGIVGDERRLDWVDAIKNIQDERNFLPIQYEVFAQQNFLLDPNLPLANLELRGSKMGLNMKLLHEMDLFNFLNDLSQKSFFEPLACTISRIGATLENPQPTGLAAECSLLWITMKEKTVEPAPAL